jgi:hypothetical protein
MFTAHTFSSGIFATGSRLGLVKTFAAASEKWINTKQVLFWQLKGWVCLIIV